jgi:hypothetical protein
MSDVGAEENGEPNDTYNPESKPYAAVPLLHGRSNPAFVTVYKASPMAVNLTRNWSAKDAHVCG